MAAVAAAAAVAVAERGQENNKKQKKGRTSYEREAVPSTTEIPLVGAGRFVVSHRQLSRLVKLYKSLVLRVRASVPKSSRCETSRRLFLLVIVFDFFVLVLEIFFTSLI